MLFYYTIGLVCFASVFCFLFIQNLNTNILTFYIYLCYTIFAYIKKYAVYRLEIIRRIEK